MSATTVNAICYFLQSRMTGKKKRKTMHRLFVLEGFEKLPMFWVLCISVLDVVYSISLFWAATTVPFFVLAVQFQSFVAFHTLFGRLFFQLAVAWQ